MEKMRESGMVCEMLSEIAVGVEVFFCVDGIRSG